MVGVLGGRLACFGCDLHCWIPNPIPRMTRIPANKIPMIIPVLNDFVSGIVSLSSSFVPPKPPQMHSKGQAVVTFAPKRVVPQSSAVMVLQSAGSVVNPAQKLGSSTFSLFG